MHYLIICLCAFLASGLTLFSGFGLGTLLLPVMALFFPIDAAIADRRGPLPQQPLQIRPLGPARR